MQGYGCVHLIANDYALRIVIGYAASLPCLPAHEGPYTYSNLDRRHLTPIDLAQLRSKPFFLVPNSFIADPDPDPDRGCGLLHAPTICCSS